MAAKPVGRLDGWKAVADHLGRNVRTAQRWRDTRRMPVHRVPGGKGGGVFAERAELDAWLYQAVTTARAQIAAPEDENGGSPPARHAPEPRWVGWVSQFARVSRAFVWRAKP